MMQLPKVLTYTAMTFVAWGLYGIILHQGQEAMHHSYLLPFIGVGIAYFIIAVLGAGALLGGRPEKGYWSFGGSLLSFLAGSVGALGALGVILALAFGGKPFYVMPLIFGGAPVINTLVTTWLAGTYKQIKPLFVIGMILVGVGMVGVLLHKPAPAKAAAVASTSAATSTVSNEAATTAATTDAAPTAAAPIASTTPFYFWRVTFSIILAIVCWGSYGPFLHLGQMRMGGSRLRPFCCVGLAYFAIAVALPLMLLPTGMDGGHYTHVGMLWSILAGTAGAVGALGIILAFNSGGKPVFVMPLVFGFAPVVNTLVSMGLAGTLSQIEPLFIGSLGTLIGGAVMVLIFQPKAKHGPSHTPAAAAPPATVPVPISPAPSAPYVSTPSEPLTPLPPLRTEAPATSPIGAVSPDADTPPASPIAPSPSNEDR